MTADSAEVLLGAHPHGYLLIVEPPTSRGTGHDRGSSTSLPPDVAGWRVERDLLPGTTVHLQPRTVLARATGSPGSVVLLGHPVDVAAGIIDPQLIAERLCTTWDHSGEEAMVGEAADLGGRWTLIAGARTDERARLLVVPDTHATQPVFIGRDSDRGLVALASSASLTAAVLGAGVDETALTLLETLRSRLAGRTAYLPGQRTAFHGVSAQLPNSLSRITVGAGVCTFDHERFWPRRQRVETQDVDAVYALFRERISAHVGLLAQFGRPAVSLTAGLDSRVTAAVAAQPLRERDGLAFTYLNPRDAVRSLAVATDVTGANSVAARLGVPHQVLRWRQPPTEGTFDVLHRRTFAPLVPSRGAAHAMWADLPRDLIQLQSNGAESGTTFARSRRSSAVTPERLMEMMMGGQRGAHDDLAQLCYGTYLESAEFTADRLLGYDHHDVFYWEQRMGRWGWQKFVDGDFGHRILLPFNDRVLLETMHSLPYPARRDKVLFTRLFDDVPQVRLSARTEPVRPRLERALLRRMPGTVRGKIDRSMSERRRQQALQRLTWPGGYALLPPEDVRRHPGPPGWVSQMLPGGQLQLVHHPGLAPALAQGSDPGTWVLVLGEPADLPSGADGAAAVAGTLLGLVQESQDSHGVTAAAVRASALVGSWTVLLSTPAASVLITDPLLTMGARVGPEGRAVVSHESLARQWSRSGTVQVTSEQVLRVDGVPGQAQWRIDDAGPEIAALASHAADLGISRDRRLHQHVALLASRGPAVLALGDVDTPHGVDLLSLSALPAGAQAITWWDRTETTQTEALIQASGAALAAGITHRIVPIRESTTADHRGPSAPGHGLQALMRTWGQDPTSADLPAPLGDTLSDSLPEDAVLWLGSRAEPAHVPRAVHLVQGVRRVALPFSDRVLDLLEDTVPAHGSDPAAQDGESDVR